MTEQSKSDFWMMHVTKWKDSGLSQTAYCREHQLRLSTFTYWRGKEAKKTPKLIPLSVSPRSTDETVVVTLPGNAKIHLRESTLERTLPMVLHLLREQPEC
ncbi:IS66 family insertion sequence element accessory protein TnpA [Microbulbifer sp. SSSA002]|uniref:IS66 family insertion sequence element accessory protein TnpA n=1 Tax=Microbulbifer sp. SSSA002 TaxID=3243376 RepID=UPI004039D21C